jgi:hypothetical protein
VTGFTGELGNSSINVDVTHGNGRLGWAGYNNLPTAAQWVANAGISILARVSFPVTSTGNWGIFDLGNWGLSGPGHMLLYLTGGQLEIIQAGFNTSNGIVFSAAASLSTNTIYDLVVLFDGTTLKIYINNVLFTTQTSSQTWSAITFPWPSISMGAVSGVGSGTYVNEFVVWSGVINPASVSCGGSNVALNGNSRTNFVDCNVFDGSVYTDPGAANVLNGTGYTFAGVSETGTLTSTDPGVANVLSGVNYTINNAAKTGTYVVVATGNVKIGVVFGAGSSQTGTYTGSDRWSDPGFANVLNGVGYLANNVSKTGTLLSIDPGVANVLIGIGYEINSVSLTGTANFSDPGVANVVSGVAYVFDSVNKTGTYVEPTTAQVKHGVVFGPASSLTGTYTGNDLWSDPGAGNVVAGINYLVNGVNTIGTFKIPVSTSRFAGRLSPNQGVNLTGFASETLSSAKKALGGRVNQTNNLNAIVGVK